MRGFGWNVGIESCGHLGDADTAAFVCVLGMPWVSPTPTPPVDATGVPALAQPACAHGFREWLTPWSTSRVAWQLWAYDGASWVQLPATPLDVSEPPLPAHADALRARCVARLDALVAGHTDAMGLTVQGPYGQTLSYPVVSPGVALKPAPLSEQVLGASCVLLVDRDDIPKPHRVVALPVFTFDGGTVAPLPGLAATDNILQVPYGGGGGPRTVAQDDYAFFGCVVQTTTPEAFVDVDPAPLRIGSGAPDSQIRATVTRELYPLKIWLDALDDKTAPTVGDADFCACVASLMGGGEDELQGGTTVVGSVYELMLDHDDYARVFDIRDNAQKVAIAQAIASRYRALLADGAGLAKCFVELDTSLQRAGLSMGDSLATLAKGATSAVGAPAIDGLRAAARRLQTLLSMQSPDAQVAWLCWFIVLAPRIIPVPAATLGDILARWADSIEPSPAQTSPSQCPLLADDVLRLMNGQIDHAAGFLEALHATPDLSVALKDVDNRKSFVQALVTRTGLPAVEASVASAYDAAVKRILAAFPTHAPEADDAPLRLYYSAHTAPSSELIRGFVLALRAGVPSAGGVVWKSEAWLTNFFARTLLPDGSAVVVAGKSSGQPLLFCDTQGGTLSDGLQEQVCAYTGHALFAAPVQGADPLENQVFVPFEAQATPPLALGAYYAGLSGTVDNAGAIREAVLRGARPGELRSGFHQTDGTSLFPATGYRYLSCQPPSQPTFAIATDWGVADETLAFEVLKQDAPKFNVAVLFSGDEFVQDASSQRVSLRAPTVGKSFVTRWLNADAMVAPGDPFRWDRVEKLGTGDIQALVDAAGVVKSGQPGARSQAVGVTHPAVDRLRLSVSWYGESGAQVILPNADPISLPLRHLAGTTWLREEFVVDAVQVQGAPAASMVPVASGVRISVPKGYRAKVEVVSVVAGRHVDGTFARLQKEAIAGQDRPFKAEGNDFVSSTPEVLWIESLPNLPADPLPSSFRPGDFKLSLPRTVDAVPELSVDIAGDLPASWLRGFTFEYKRWRWSGYQIDFPGNPDIGSWLPLYAGTTNETPRLPAGRFSTHVAASGWRVKGLVMKPVPLAAVRPVSHVGVELTPLLRFAKLLKPGTRSGPTIFLYDVLPGTPRSLEERLPPPLWDDATPLPQTSDLAFPATVTSRPRGKGNLLTVRNAIYDTADAAAFGGIAERYELDVVGTWHENVSEAGPNPIFHGNDPLPGLDLVLEAPFGLSYDQVVGGQPAQTGLIVRPASSQGRWIMAKCRLRRLELPENVLGSAFGDGEAGINFRSAGDEWVPQDFAAHCDVPLNSLKVGTTDLRLPTFAGSLARCYLVTWHKERWNGAKPTWRAQVNLYRRDGASWTLLAKVPGFQQDDFDFSGAAPRHAELTVGGNATFYSVRASDFTDARWLSFIGNFGLSSVPDARQYRLRYGGGAFVLEANAHGVDMPKLKAFDDGDDPCASILLVYAPGRDLMRASMAQEGGNLIGVYGMGTAPGAANPRFDSPLLEPRQLPSNWGECMGVVIQTQGVNPKPAGHPLMSLDKSLRWNAFLEELFPSEGRGSPEAVRRVLPEYLAPLTIVG